MFPFFLGYTAALLERDGFDVHVLDGVPLNLSVGQFVTETIRIAPEVIILEPAAVSLGWVQRLAATLKGAIGATVVFAGAHATVNRCSILAGCTAVDYVLGGEYEATCLDLLRCMRDRTSQRDLTGVSMRCASGRIEDGGIAEPLADLDLLPPPARHLFPSRDHHDLGLYHDGFCQMRPAVQLHSSRGCPFSCSFCVLPQVMYQGAGYRTFSPRRVVDEMAEAAERFGAREIYFDDDTFVGSRPRVHKICAEIQSRGLKTPWSIMADATLLDETLVRVMAESGCIGIKMGLESTSERVLKTIGKPVRPHQVERVIEEAKCNGMKTHLSVSFGHLDDTPESTRDTFEFVCRLDVDSVQFSIATPYPGTRFFEEARRRGVLVDSDFSRYDPWHRAVVATPELPQDFLEEFHTSAHRRWLRRKLVDARWVSRQVRHLRRLAHGQGLGGVAQRLKRGCSVLTRKEIH
jgi:radical SAM superfamily enzyme YgiQ (UPF0313 family)